MCVHSLINTNKKEMINLKHNAESDIDILTSCPYMEWEDIRNYSSETFDLKIMHLNVCSILAKQTELKELLNGLYTENLDLNAILLYETYLNAHTLNLVNVPGFNLICKNRTKLKNSGFAISIKNNFNYIIWDDISIFKEGEFESVLIDIHFKKGHDVTLGSVFRVPGTSETRYISQIIQVINKIKLLLAPTKNRLLKNQ